MWESINNWISGHQALVVAVGVPFLTAIAAAVVSIVTTRMNMSAQKLDRDLQLQFRRYEHEREKVSSVRELFSEFEKLTFSSGIDLQHGLSSGAVNLVSREHAKGIFDSAISLFVQMRLMVPADDIEAKQLSEIAFKEMLAISDADAVAGIPPEKRFASISERVLTRMEEKLLTMLH